MFYNWPERMYLMQIDAIVSRASHIVIAQLLERRQFSSEMVKRERNHCGSRFSKGINVDVCVCNWEMGSFPGIWRNADTSIK